MRRVSGWFLDQSSFFVILEKSGSFIVMMNPSQRGAFALACLFFVHTVSGETIFGGPATWDLSN